MVRLDIKLIATRAMTNKVDKKFANYTVKS